MDSPYSQTLFYIAVTFAHFHSLGTMPLPTDSENICKSGSLRHSAFSTNSLRTMLSRSEAQFTFSLLKLFLIASSVRFILRSR